jgi:hypothetical protein
MITFKNIIEEYKKKSRSEEINDKTKSLDKLIYKYTGNKSIENRTTIYRGKKDTNRPILYVQPSKYKRESMHSHQYHMILIDNSKYWKDYPKRTRSIICSTDKSIKARFEYDEEFELYQVVPKLNARIAICPEEDMWYSFKTGFKIINKMVKDSDFKIDDIESFNDAIDTMSDGVMAFKYIKQSIVEAPINKKQKEYIKKYNCNNLYELIDYCLSPELNGFKLTTYNDNFKLSGKHEVWTDADSLMINNWGKYIP